MRTIKWSWKPCKWWIIQAKLYPNLTRQTRCPACVYRHYASSHQSPTDLTSQKDTINYSYSTVQKLKQVIGPLSVQCNLPFQHKLKCKIQTGSAGDKVVQGHSVLPQDVNRPSLLGVWKKEWNSSQLLEWNYGALKTGGKKDSHVLQRTRCLLPLCFY